MALLRSNVRIIQRAQVNLYFEDDNEKHIEVAEKDIIRIRYNDSGYVREITGKVTSIVTKPQVKDIPRVYPPTGSIPMHLPDRDSGYFIVDGSAAYYGNRVHVYFDHILDIEMIERFEDFLLVKTEVSGAVSKIRVTDDELQLFVNGNYVPVSKLLGKTTVELLEKLQAKEDEPPTTEDNPPATNPPAENPSVDEPSKDNTGTETPVEKPEEGTPSDNNGEDATE